MENNLNQNSTNQDSVNQNSANQDSTNQNSKMQQNQVQNINQYNGQNREVPPGYYAGYNNPYMANQQITNVQYEERKRRSRQASKERFAKYGIASLIFALVAAIGLYKSLEGIFNVIGMVAVVCYIAYIAKISEKKLNKFVIFNCAGIIILSISTFLTGNYTIIFFNYLMILTLIIISGIYIFVDVNNLLTFAQALLVIIVPFSSIENMFTAIGDFIGFITNTKIKKYSKVTYVILGILITIPVFAVILIMLMTADAVFEGIFSEILKKASIDYVISNIIGFSVAFILLFISSYGIASKLGQNNFTMKKGKIKNFEPIIGIILSGTISVLYAIFCIIQIYYLFLGKGKLPENYTYSSYAREGFFQLLFISIFNMILVLIGNEFFRNNKILKCINVFMSVCTFIMIASSAYRMLMYIGEYGLTFIRVLVLWALAVITIIMIGLIIQVISLKFNLFKYSVVVITVAYIGLALSRPDYYIAYYDLNMYSDITKNNYREDYVDYEYIDSLSTDAAIPIGEHFDEMYRFLKKNDYDIHNSEWACVYDKNEYGEVVNEIGIRNLNVSEYIAQNKFESVSRRFK